jgi:arylsulfatase A-like enzyme
MFRAPPHGRTDAAPRPAPPRAVSSPEPALAVALCLVVVLATTALLERSSSLSRRLGELQRESLVQGRGWRRPSGPRAATLPRPARIVLLSIDGLRSDVLRDQGPGASSAPALAALAAESIAFEAAAAQASHPLISHKSLLTGKHPATLMLEETGADWVELATLRDGRAYLLDTFGRVEGTLAEALRASGFATAAFVGAHLAPVAGFARGFERYDRVDDDLGTRLARATDWLAANARAPAFLFVRAGEVAQAASPAPAVDAGAAAAAYRDAVGAADSALAGFLADLEARDLRRGTLLVVTSAHGASLGEDGSFGHGGLAAEQLLVPLLLSFPPAWNVLPRASADPVELVDLAPTLLVLGGAPVAKDLDGASLLPGILRGIRARDYLVAQCALDEPPQSRSSPAQRTFLRPGRWQVVHDVERGRATLRLLAPEARAEPAVPIAAAEFAPLLATLLAGSSTKPGTRLSASSADQVGAELARALHALGYGARAPQARHAGAP